ncbi:lipid-A-disaccharide synthase [Chlamydia felis Fe/C-56]|uniref:Lipid-A-disaccharide synthase n=1 Tax=Chlamydia felis (strain Fe/C-56) TaxID=264202 RepID=LPXB_CHLFF|nr:lipid-A-disaccharide synthase [Chlamydia felis]Q255P5.1 RecName: Full=Lipid-A-disaccharide synthase [Chlamydia felis Fe/C-56]BAE80993.1 lipid-A-disaccharide synthase [Chlamydia felis Fe/C-56]
MLPLHLVHVLYPIGLIANLFFGSAFTIQWFLSERRKKACVPKSFWILSSIGAVMMIAHGFIQSQFPIALLHGANLVIYFRNLNVSSSHSLSLRATLFILVVTLLLTTLPFVLGSYYYPNMQWMASPNIFHLPLPPPNIYWHIAGCIGLFTFSSRFFIQWCHLEINNRSTLPALFWLVSFIGGFLAFLYFIRTGDPVNIISYGCGLLPSLANLLIIYKKSRLPEFHNHSYFLSAGEPSGDILGSDLLHNIKTCDPTIRCFGVGGPLMRKEGFEPLIHMEEFQVSGFLEVFFSIFGLFKKYRRLYKAILQENPETVFCIDFPDFHFFLIKKLRKCGYKGKIIHYVCPSIWAWRPKRKKILEKYLDTLLLILPFEKDLFINSPLKTIYLGHPLVKTISNFQYCSSWKQQLSISDQPIVALFPGSRPGDIFRNLQVQIRAFLASSLAQSHQILVSSCNPKYDKNILDVLEKEGCRGKIISSTFRYQLMRDCDCALAKCGTIVLEAALNQTPTIVTCLLGPIDTFLAKYIFKILMPAYSLPNIITGSIIFPEFIGGKHDFNPEEVAAAIDILAKPKSKEKQKLACQQLLDTLMTNVVTPEECLRIICSQNSHLHLEKGILKNLHPRDSSV